MNAFEVYLKHKSFKKVMNVFDKKEAVELFKILLKTDYLRSVPLKSFNENEILVSSHLLLQDFDFILKNKVEVEFLADYRIIDELVATEVVSTLAIENIYTSREEVTSFMQKGYSKDQHIENTTGALKFIEECVNNSVDVTKDSVKELYEVLMKNTLGDQEEFPGYYRNDRVFVVSATEKKHEGAPYTMISSLMEPLYELMNQKENKYSLSFMYTMIHFYIGYVHPYFDGNGRMARLLSAWYLLRNNVSKIFVYQLSKYINERKQEYYRSYETVEFEENITGHIVLDEFVSYFIEIGEMVTKSRIYSLKYQIMLVEEPMFRHFTFKEKSILFTIINSKYNKTFTTGSVVHKDFADRKTIKKILENYRQLGIVELTERQNEYKLTTEFKLKLEE